MKTAYVAIGGNLTPEGYDTLEDVMADALKSVANQALEIEQVSKWFETAPVPVSDQPWFLNAILRVRTKMSATQLLACLHDIEANFGRVRKQRNEARILDLDLIDYDGLVQDDETITVPHPRMHQRAFVLLPLQDIDPNWHHPVTNIGISQLIAQMPEGQDIRLKA